MAKKEKEEIEVEGVVENTSIESRINWAEEIVDKNKNILIGVLIAVVVAVAGFFYWNKTNGEKEVEAQKEIYPAQYYFSQDSLDIVLKGNGNIVGVEEIADDYSGTKAGNLANFYAGAAHLKKGNFEEAIDYLKSFSSDDLLVQARAYSLIGDAYMELNDLGNAITYYQKASEKNPTQQFTPRYLLKLGLAYELNDNLSAAAESYNTIIKDFYASSETDKAKKYLALVNAKQGKK